MNYDSGADALLLELERITRDSPPQTQLPATRELQKRFRVSALTTQRVLAALAARGLLVTRPGRGTFTAAAPTPGRALDPSWQVLALGARPELAVELDDLLAPVPAGTVSLVTAFLDPSLQPLGLLQAAAGRAARRPGSWAHPSAEGLPELRAHLAAELGPGHRADDVLIAPGGQAALAAAFRYLAAPGDPVVVESPTYPGALAAARNAGLRLVPVPTDADGVLPDALEEALTRSGARLVYLQPRHANPTGATLSADRRDPVLAAVTRAGAFLVEDDWVRDLDLDGPTPPPLATRDSHGAVVHIRSLTKPVAAGLRVSGLIARGPVLARLRRGRLCDDLFVSPLLQQIAVDVLTAPGWPRHLAGVRRVLRERRAALLQAVLGLPGVESVGTPRGGVHLWVRLPAGVEERTLVEAARRHGVAVGAGRAYVAGEPDAAHLRLSYGAAAPETLREGVARLGTALREVS
ncbi:MAG TPA: PLP-dependent aminotransferase family protein [Sporichthyaceae bacterium]|jgi:DNA-binding transcriptional MocR family regulator